MIKLVCAGAALLVTASGIALAQPAPPAADRSVSISEMQQRHSERFNAMDANKDGQLSQQEMQSAPRGPGMRGMRGDRFAMGPRGPGRGSGALFRRADANNDGIVTQQEFTADALGRFRQLDANRDGRIAGDEAQGRHGQMGERRFTMLDADRNGAVSRAEFDQRFAERLARLDANRDGRVTREERRAARARPAARP